MNARIPQFPLRLALVAVCAIGQPAIGQAQSARAAKAANAAPTQATLTGTGYRFDVPAGWHVREEAKPGSPALFITREKIEGDRGEFLTGFSLNAFQRVHARDGHRPSEKAANFIRSFTAQNPHATVSQRELRPGVRAVRIELVSTHRPPPVRIVYQLIADDAADTLVLAWFESPTDTWTQHQATAERLFAQLLASPSPVSTP